MNIFNLVTAVLLTVSATGMASAHEIECRAGRSSNYAVIPHFHAATNNDAAFYVTNHSNKTVEIKIEIYTHTGASYTGPLVTYYMFSTSNDPFQNWAVLASKEQGMLHVPLKPTTTSGHARISWKSSECLGKPVTVSLQRTATGNPGLSIESYGPF